MSTALETLLLARLACSPEGLTSAALRRELAPLTERHLSPAEWRQTVPRLAAALVAQGLVESVRRGRLLLTPQGRTELGRRLPGPALGTFPQWKDVCDRMMCAALGEREPAAVSTAEALRKTLVAGAHQLPASARKSQAKLLDALTAKALGLPQNRPLTKADLQRHLLRPLLGGAQVAGLEQVVPLLAARTLGARGGEGRQLRSAALAQFLFGRPPAADARTEAPARPTSAPAHPPSLHAFAEHVLAAARASPPEARFGSDKVFISELWRQLADSAHAGEGEGDFKRRLGEAQREGHLRLSRADVVELMDAQRVSASELRFENAVFHFVRL